MNIFKNDHCLRGNAKARSFDFYQDWELSANPSERKGNVDIVLSDKQEAYLQDIYHRMLKEAEQLIAQGFHQDAFDVALQICFA